MAGTSIFEKRLAIVDVETTGASPINDRIVEIAVIIVDKGKIVETINTVIDPETYIHPSIAALTGISEEEIKRAPTFADISHDLKSVLDGCIFVAHNARFDYGFVRNEFKRLGQKFSAENMCTVKLSRALFPSYKKHDLSTIIERYGFECEARHRAYPDAYALFDFLTYCENNIEKDTYKKALDKTIGANSLPPHLAQDILKTLPKSAGVYIFYGEDGEKLYVGKSVNIRTRVLSHFAGNNQTNKGVRLSHEVRDIEAIQTPGNLSALLLESHLIKKEQPLYNRMLRHAKKLVVVLEEVSEAGYKHAVIKTLDKDAIDGSHNILAIFRSKSQATNWLRMTGELHKLCPQFLGLEKEGKGKCFMAQLGKCNGACAGKETSEIYNTRFELAFRERRVKSWPFQGPVLITENSDRHSGAGFIVNDWRLEGSFLFDDAGNKSFLPADYVFDYDSYKILSAYLTREKRRNTKLLTTQEIESLKSSIA